MRNKKQVLAAWGENLAASYLENKGYRILQKNYRCPYGEIDLIARRDDPAKLSHPFDTHDRPPNSSGPLTVFVEVKTRSSTAYGFPELSVNEKKQAHLLACAQEYIRLNHDLEGEWRVDVIAILRSDQDRPAQIQHFENAITAD